MKNNRSTKRANVFLYFLATLLASPFLFIAIMGFTYGWTENRDFGSEALDGLHQADAILIANGLCPSSNRQCQENKVAIYWAGFAAKEPAGFIIQIFGTTDQQLLKQLSQIFVDQFNKVPNMRHLKIQARALSKAEYNKEFLASFRNPLILNIDLERAGETTQSY